MLEVVMAGHRHGRGVINSSTAYRGTHCYIQGVNADGYQLLALPYDSAQGARAVYPVNKYYFEEDLNDTSDAVDKLTKGDLIIYYEGGEYITDKFDQASLGLTPAYWSVVENLVATAYGAKLYVPGSSTAQGTTGLDKLYVSSGYASGWVLFGDTTFSVGTIAQELFIGFAIGVYYTDSSDAKLHYRIHPNRNVSLNSY